MRWLSMIPFLLFACADEAPPTWSSDAELTATQEGPEVVLEWPDAEDETGVSEYRILRDDERIATIGSSTRTHRATGLSSVTEYRFTVLAVDEAGNRSEPLHVRHTTEDGEAPTWPAGSVVQATVQDAQVHLRWSPAEDDVSVDAYEVARGDETLTELATTTYVLDGEDTNGLRVRAKDRAGNVSGWLNARVTTEGEDLVTEVAQQVAAMVPVARIPNQRLEIPRPPNVRTARAIERLRAAPLEGRLQVQGLMVERPAAME